MNITDHDLLKRIRETVFRIAQAPPPVHESVAAPEEQTRAAIRRRVSVHRSSRRARRAGPSDRSTSSPPEIPRPTTARSSASTPTRAWLPRATR